MLRFEYIDLLYALILIPAMIILYWFIRQLRKKNLKKFGDIQLITQLFPDASGIKPLLKFTLLLTALAFIIIGLANLQVGTKLEKVKREGVDVMIALDVSKSMDAEDVKPSRLAKAKRAISELIDNLDNDRIGLIAFAGDAYLQLPLTTDFSAAKLFLSTISTKIVSKQGTAIGAAIKLAEKSFPKNDKLHRALIMITDGENHEDDAAGAAEDAAKQGIIIHTIGIGTLEGSPIPIFKRGQQVDFVRDNQGSVVVTKLNPEMLEQIANASNGKFILSTGSNLNLTKLISEIGGMKKKEFGSKIFTDYEDRFQYFFGGAFLLLLIELLLSNKKNKVISSWNLFGAKNEIL